MAYSRFFLESELPLSANERARATSDVLELPLSKDDLHHAVSVLRATTAEKIAVVEPLGGVFLVEIESCSKHGMTGRVVGEIEVDSLPPVTLIQGVSRGERMDLCVRMSVEVGVSEIVPVLTERCTVKIEPSKREQKRERWERIARAAAKQSGRVAIPQVQSPVELDELLRGVDAEVTDDTTHNPKSNTSAWDLIVVAWEEDSGRSLRQVLIAANLDPLARVAIVIGPEGGLTAEEVDALKAVGAQTCTLGDTILRTETAGVVASALVLYERGALGGRV